MNLGRKIKRQQEKENRKLEKKIKSKLMMFDHLPEECLVCEKAFDKTNKEMVQTWSVVVREKEELVRLYCPDCWTKARTVVQNYFEGIQNESSS